jgi:hypothetical protein
MTVAPPEAEARFRPASKGMGGSGLRRPQREGRQSARFYGRQRTSTSGAYGSVHTEWFGSAQQETSHLVALVFGSVHRHFHSCDFLISDIGGTTPTFDFTRASTGAGPCVGVGAE